MHDTHPLPPPLPSRHSRRSSERLPPFPAFLPQSPPAAFTVPPLQKAEEEDGSREEELEGFEGGEGEEGEGAEEDRAVGGGEAAGVSGEGGGKEGAGRELGCALGRVSVPV